MLKRTMLVAPILLALTTTALAREEARKDDAHVSLTATYSQKVLLKNWALSYCIGQITSDQKLKREAQVAQSGYLEFGRQGLDAYEALKKEVDLALSRKAAGITDADYTVMKCIDLFHGKRLDKLVNKLTAGK